MAKKRLSVRVLTDEEQEAHDILRKKCPLGTEVYVAVWRVGRENGSAVVDVFVPEVVDGKPTITRITHVVALVCGYDRSRERAIRLSNEGLGWRHQVAIDLGRKLYGKDNANALTGVDL